MKSGRTTKRYPTAQDPAFPESPLGKGQAKLDPGPIQLKEPWRVSIWKACWSCGARSLRRLAPQKSTMVIHPQVLPRCPCSSPAQPSKSCTMVIAVRRDPQGSGWPKTTQLCPAASFLVSTALTLPSTPPLHSHCEFLGPLRPG